MRACDGARQAWDPGNSIGDVALRKVLTANWVLQLGNLLDLVTQRRYLRWLFVLVSRTDVVAIEAIILLIRLVLQGIWSIIRASSSTILRRHGLGSVTWRPTFIFITFIICFVPLMDLLWQILRILRLIIWVIFVRLILMRLIFFIGISIIISSWRLSMIEIDSIESFDVLSLTIILTVWGICRTPRGPMRYKPCQPRNTRVIIMGLGDIPQVFLWSTLIRSSIWIYIIILYDNQVLIALALLAHGVLLFAGWVEPSIFGIFFRNRTLIWLFINELIIAHRCLLFVSFLGNLLHKLLPFLTVPHSTTANISFAVLRR